MFQELPNHSLWTNTSVGCAGKEEEWSNLDKNVAVLKPEWSIFEPPLQSFSYGIQGKHGHLVDN